MQATFKPKNIDQLLVEADQLIKQIDSHVVKDLEEEHRVLFEKHAQSEGMHKAIDDIVKAMKNLGSYFS
jgi:oligoribonuclease (3'-5' exoribonuclease)